MKAMERERERKRELDSLKVIMNLVAYVFVFSCFSPFFFFFFFFFCL